MDKVAQTKGARCQFQEIETAHQPSNLPPDEGDIGLYSIHVHTYSISQGQKTLGHWALERQVLYISLYCAPQPTRSLAAISKFESFARVWDRQFAPLRNYKSRSACHISTGCIAISILNRSLILKSWDLIMQMVYLQSHHCNITIIYSKVVSLGQARMVLNFP